LTRSSAASSLGVSGPWRSIVASAEVEVGVNPVASAAASCRSRRAVRTIPSRSWAAESVSGVFGAFGGID
jgi:hypothetical protein